MQNPSPPTSSAQIKRSGQEIKDWLIAYIANILETSPSDININIPFDEYGMDSAMTVGLAADLEDWLGLRLESTVTYDYQTIDSLAHYLDTN